MPSPMMNKNNVIYDKCRHIKRTKPDYHVDEEVIKDIGTNFRTIPTFENSLYDRVYVRRYSFARNERLRCCWRKYVQNIESRVFAPFHFPNIRDLHLRNNAIEYVPTENRCQSDNRMKFKPGPGIDEKGQMPIPQELLMRRSGHEKLKENDKKELDKKRLTKKKSVTNLLGSKKRTK